MMSLALAFGQHLFSQSFLSQRTGNENSVDVQPDFGICLMGGAGESDEAMTWFLEKANGGDVLVLRAGGIGGYNDYLFNELGVTINSVETIAWQSAEASNDPYVVQRLNEAEAIWMAGGDQDDYIDYWQGTPVEDALNNLLNVKQGAVGGISAGMAVLGQAYFSAALGTITQEAALANPYAPQMVIGYNDFIVTPYMENVITETHLNDPDRIRYGRIVAFMARFQADQGVRPFGMASNEFCGIAIEETGEARAFGEFPDFEDDYVYFLQANCEDPQGPEIIEPDQPLTWIRNNEAIKVYKVPATTNGNNYFDLNTWNTGEGGAWENWYVNEGELVRVEDAEPPNCALGLRSLQPEEIKVYPNPARDQVWVELPEPSETSTYQIFSAHGVLVKQGILQGNMPVNITDLSDGFYQILIDSTGRPLRSGFLKIK
jgi:cyanophycinase-like exopeptidase